jgi:hypothetical protein
VTGGGQRDWAERTADFILAEVAKQITRQLQAAEVVDLAD